MEAFDLSKVIPHINTNDLHGLFGEGEQTLNAFILAGIVP